MSRLWWDEKCAPAVSGGHSRRLSDECIFFPDRCLHFVGNAFGSYLCAFYQALFRKALPRHPASLYGHCMDRMVCSVWYSAKYGFCVRQNLLKREFFLNPIQEVFIFKRSVILCFNEKSTLFIEAFVSQVAQKTSYTSFYARTGYKKRPFPMSTF